jgi:hypothetical protein
MQINFQAGVEDIYDACVAKGSTPASTSLADVVAGIMAIPSGITPSGTISITANGTGIDVSQYASADVAVPNNNSGTYNFPTNDTGAKKDLGVTNTYRYVTATNVYNKGKADGRSFSTQNRSKALASGQTTFTFSFSTKVVGVYKTNCSGWYCGYVYSISGNNVIIYSNGSSGNSFTVYAYGY